MQRADGRFYQMIDAFDGIMADLRANHRDNIVPDAQGFSGANASVFGRLLNAIGKGVQHFAEGVFSLSHKGTIT